MQAATAEIVSRKSHGRSRVSNGSAVLPTVDGRSIWARLMRDTNAALERHCGEDASETLRMTRRRVSVLEAELVFLEDKMARTRAAGGEPDADTVELYGRLSDRQRRLNEILGWQPTARDVTPTLSQYLAAEAAREAAENAAGESASSGNPVGERTSGLPTDSQDHSERAGAAAPAASGEPERDASDTSALGSPVNSSKGGAGA